LQAFSKKIMKHIRSHERKIKLLMIVILTLIIAIVSSSTSRVIEALKNLKKLQNIIENKLFNTKEFLEFQNADFSLKIPSKEGWFLVNSKIKQSESLEISGQNPYIASSFEGIVFEYNGKNEWVQKLVLTSDFIEFVKKSVKIFGNVKGILSSKINEKHDGLEIYSSSITAFSSKDLAGEKLFIKAKEGNFSAQIFEITENLTKGFFQGKVRIENKEYVVSSNFLDAVLHENEIHNAHFKGNVFFRQKIEDKTEIKADSAIYNRAKNNIVFKGNIVSSSRKNNTKIKGDRFIYNIKTSVGKIDAKPTEKIEVELEI
jgi:lipopolysaccharide export system protein LptA